MDSTLLDPPNHPRRLPSFAGLRVALVDDDQPCRNSLHELLRAAGVTCEAYESVAALIRHGGIRRAHCLILDVLMPEIDGLALQTCLKRTNYDVPIIFCSGCPDEEVRQKALRDGAVCFLLKPVQCAALFEALMAACRKSGTS